MHDTFHFGQLALDQFAELLGVLVSNIGAVPLPWLMISLSARIW